MDGPFLLTTIWLLPLLTAGCSLPVARQNLRALRAIALTGNGMNLLEIPSYYQQVVKGLVFVLAVLLDFATKGRPKTG